MHWQKVVSIFAVNKWINLWSWMSIRLTLCDLCYQNANGHQKKLSLLVCHCVCSSILRLKIFWLQRMAVFRFFHLYVKRRESIWSGCLISRISVEGGNQFCFDCYDIQTVRTEIIIDNISIGLSNFWVIMRL